MFSVQIWGTVAQWASASLTGGGVMIASLVYWRDSNLSRSAQAKQVHLRVAPKERFDPPKWRDQTPQFRDNRFIARVQNFSDSNIYNVHVSVEPIPLKQVLDRKAQQWSYLPDLRIVREQVSELPAIVDDYYAWCRSFNEERRPHPSNGDPDIVPKLESVEFIIDKLERDQMIVVQFNDLKGRWWRLTRFPDERTKLSLSGDWTKAYRKFRWRRDLHPKRIVRLATARYLLWRAIRGGSEKAKKKEWKQMKRRERRAKAQAAIANARPLEASRDASADTASDSQG